MVNLRPEAGGADRVVILQPRDEAGPPRGRREQD
jgi:hypothetical protein